MNKPYNGHKNWNHWNVSLWINNDEGLYRLAQEAVRRHRNKTEAAQAVLDYFTCLSVTKTPDGAPYTVTSIRAAMRGM